MRVITGRTKRHEWDEDDDLDEEEPQGKNVQQTIDDLFDDTAGYEDDTGIKLAPGLTAEERHRATILYHVFNELWGLCVVFGDPGTGKDTFGNYLSYTLHRFFPWKRVMRDEKPRKLFGLYSGLFNEQVISDELDKMREIAKNYKKSKEVDHIGLALEKAADDWVTDKGQVLLKNSILYLTEFWRYCYNREPHNPMNKTMGGIHKMKRHIQTLVIGTAQLEGDLDRKTCKPFIDWKVTCTKSSFNPTGFTYYIQKVKYDKRLDLLIPIGRTFPMPVDAGKPRSYMGDGKIIIRRTDYLPETEEERIVLDVLRAGVDTYEGLVDILETQGDMEEWEVLATLKSLKFGKDRMGRFKRVVEYPCVFGLFNSRSAPQMRSSVRVGD